MMMVPVPLQDLEHLVGLAEAGAHGMIDGARAAALERVRYVESLIARAKAGETPPDETGRVLEAPADPSWVTFEDAWGRPRCEHGKRRAHGECPGPVWRPRP